MKLSMSSSSSLTRHAADAWAAAALFEPFLGDQQTPDKSQQQPNMPARTRNEEARNARDAIIARERRNSLVEQACKRLARLRTALSVRRARYLSSSLVANTGRGLFGLLLSEHQENRSAVLGR
jgi:hypothetical protein